MTPDTLLSLLGLAMSRNDTGLTRRQRECLAFIDDYDREHGVTPSYDEMKDHLGLASKSGVARIVNALVERGHITKLENRARSIFVHRGEA